MAKPIEQIVQEAVVESLRGGTYEGRVVTVMKTAPMARFTQRSLPALEVSMGVSRTSELLNVIEYRDEIEVEVRAIDSFRPDHESFEQAKARLRGVLRVAQSLVEADAAVSLMEWSVMDGFISTRPPAAEQTPEEKGNNLLSMMMAVTVPIIRQKGEAANG